MTTIIIKDRDYVDCAFGITVGTIFLVLSFILRCLNILILMIIFNMSDDCQPYSGQTPVYSPACPLPDSQVLT